MWWVAASRWLDRANAQSRQCRVLASSNLGSHALIFDDDEVVRLLRAAVERERSQVAFARRHDLDRVYLNMVLNRKRPVGEKVAKALGLRKVYTSAE